MRRHQRGLLGFSVVEIVLGVVGVVAFAGALAWANNSLKHHYLDPAKAQWDSEKSALTTDVNTCKSANKSLDDQFATFRQMHNASVQALSDEYDKAKARRSQGATEAAPKLADVAIEKFNAIVAAKGAGLSCEQLDALLLKEAERKVRYYGPATEAQRPDGPLIVDRPPTQPERAAPVNPLRPKP